MPLSRADAERLAGTRGVVLDAAGAVVGAIVAIVIEEDTGRPTWVHVEELSRGVDTFVPLADATVSGTDIALACSKTVVEQAPPVSDTRQLDPADEQVLLAYYADQGSARATSPVTGSGSMLRSEERLRVGVRVRPRERLRIVRHVVTENVTFTVPVQREELRIERIPVDENDENIGEGRSMGRKEGEPAFDQDDVEVVLHEERVEWTVEVVPVERVRFRVQTLTTQVAVGADLAVENIELEQHPGTVPDAP